MTSTIKAAAVLTVVLATPLAAAASPSDQFNDGRWRSEIRREIRESIRSAQRARTRTRRAVRREMLRERRAWRDDSYRHAWRDSYRQVWRDSVRRAWRESRRAARDLRRNYWRD